MKIIGHRGARGLAPENTLASFKKALEHHVDELEFDLRVASDRTVVIHHDPYITNPSGQRVVIRDNPLSELRRHKADLLTFEQFIKQIGKPVHLLIEIKPGEPAGPIIALIHKQLQKKWRPADISIASFDYDMLQKMHRAFPEVEMVVNESWSGIRAASRARRLNTKRLNMRASWLWIGFLRSMHRSGYQIAPYTVNDSEKVRKWQPYLYGVITDYPDRFTK